MHNIKLVLVILIFNSFARVVFAQSDSRPNVIIILTDDQGYGDLGITGNPHVKTPVIDQFARNSIRLDNFYVSPVCAPTRSSLMTGRYSLRTGIRDTYNGGATMASNEVTLAELLKQADYRTGIFGKWHLGDNYPSRPTDQGFDESLIHLAGGMGQVGDITNYFNGDRSYFDPVLWHNNRQESYKGYCSDIFAEGAIDFIEENKQGPFFCYLSFNAPHTPLQVPEEYYDRYKDVDPSAGFGQGMVATMTDKDKEDARKVYAMVSNIDDNIGKLLNKLEELKIADNTLIIFMTDNGPEQVRYVGGMRGRKSSVYNGGVRVPFYMRYPARFEGDKAIKTVAAHLDILPTVAQLCNVPLPKDRVIDGKSLVPLMEGKEVAWANRPLFFYWTRSYPELYQNIALQTEGYKLVGMTDYDAKINDFELYDLAKDPFEKDNIIAQNLDKAKVLKQDMDHIFKELITSKNLVDPQPIVVGSEHENPVILNRNDAEGERGIWNQEEIYGKWKVAVEPGVYNLKFKFIRPVEGGGQMYLETKDGVFQKKNATKEADTIDMERVSLRAMTGDLVPFYTVKGKRIFPFWVEIERVD
ncbi:arylsulfatase A-like enzyme [Dyadobacter jejuensis]|uniref:Arylsulfatase A-like enzyme n=1 Tax=Dyadobacter jejuensis TaxID=1082580 RepID=A0A316AKL0_9BACT|nr:arylsulfatase [Dyadobacter jejuensis]PWJ57779.1 arylsulfatase A-like enzyme [Dyadobacter jejuensis]